MRNRRLIPFVIIFLIVGFSGLINFSRDVRAVNVVGLFFSGFVCGAALIRFITILKYGTKREQAND